MIITAMTITIITVIKVMVIMIMKKIHTHTHLASPDALLYKRFTVPSCP